MTDHLLTLNAGSSSIKFALFRHAADGGRDPVDGAPAFMGQVEGIGLGADAALKVRGADGAVAHEGKLQGARGGKLTHEDAIAGVLAWLAHDASDVRIAAVGHRIVHGGTRFEKPVAIDDDVVAGIAELISLAPLHQPHNLAGVNAARRAFAGVPQVACFDTAFHCTQPELNRRFALPQALFDDGVRRYGFHGLSYESIVSQLMAADPARARSKVVIAHLGNGASMCALRDGKSVATTMSFSPLDGLPMGTRCGRLDAAVVLHLIQQKGRSADDVTRLLYRESGLLGLSGLSSDMRELEASESPAAKLAIDYFVEHVIRELAGMAAALRGIETFVFTGGIGENAAALRERIVNGAKWMAPFDVEVLRTNEEAVIARHTAALTRAPN
jgi:acetate kinase